MWGRAIEAEEPLSCHEAIQAEEPPTCHEGIAGGRAEAIQAEEPRRRPPPLRRTGPETIVGGPDGGGVGLPAGDNGG